MKSSIFLNRKLCECVTYKDRFGIDIDHNDICLSITPKYEYRVLVLLYFFKENNENIQRKSGVVLLSYPDSLCDGSTYQILSDSIFTAGVQSKLLFEYNKTEKIVTCNSWIRLNRDDFKNMWKNEKEAEYILDISK